MIFLQFLDTFHFQHKVQLLILWMYSSLYSHLSFISDLLLLLILFWPFCFLKTIMSYTISVGSSLLVLLDFSPLEQTHWSSCLPNSAGIHFLACNPYSIYFPLSLESWVSTKPEELATQVQNCLLQLILNVAVLELCLMIFDRSHHTCIAFFSWFH